MHRDSTPHEHMTINGAITARFNRCVECGREVLTSRQLETSTKPIDQIKAAAMQYETLCDRCAESIAVKAEHIAFWFFPGDERKGKRNA